MHPKNSFLALVAVACGLLAAAGCEQKPTAPAPVAKPAAPAAAPAPTGPSKTIAIELSNEARLGALQVDVKYEGGGRFVGDADAVACETKVDGALSSYNHIVDEKLLRAAFITVSGFQGPVRVAECRFQGEVAESDFTVTVRDSASPELTPADPAPSVKLAIE